MLAATCNSIGLPDNSSKRVNNDKTSPRESKNAKDNRPNSATANGSIVVSLMTVLIVHLFQP